MVRQSQPMTGTVGDRDMVSLSTLHGRGAELTVTRIMSRRTCERRRAATVGVESAARGSVFGLAVAAVLMVVLTGVSFVALSSAASADPAPPTRWPVYLMAASCLTLACLIVVVHGMRVAHRVVGPEHRLIQTLRRVRRGDLSFRVSLRRGDLLADLAHECNALIDWLNQNPPIGATTGSDLVDVGIEAEAQGPVVEEARR